MSRIPDNDKLPAWISEYIPAELVDSSLFRFEIQLQAIDGYVCELCGSKYQSKLKACTAINCGGNLTVAYKKVTVDLIPDLDLDYNILRDQMQDIPAQYAFWSAVYSEARLKVSIEERRLKAIKGRLVERAQTQAITNQVKLTGDQIKMVIEADDKIQVADLRLQHAQMQCGKLFHMLEALKMKAELARSLAGFKKQEHDQS